MAGLTEICNMALAHFGGQQITDIDQQSQSARVCRQFWPNVRDEALRKYPWNFCMKRIALAPVANETDPQWKYIYAYPDDCLKDDKIFTALEPNPVRPLEHKVFQSPNGGKRIYTNVADAWLEYRARITDTTQYDPSFVLAVSLLLASNICVTLSTDKGGREALYKLAMVQLSSAYKDNANEGYQEQQFENHFLEARE